MRQQKSPSNAGEGWGPFTSRQLTTIVCVAIVAVVAIPTAAIAAVGTFTSTTATPAVKGTNSSTAANAKGVEGVATGGGAGPVYGVSGSANASTNGVGVNGIGKNRGVLGVSAGTASNAAGIWGNAIATSAADHFGVWGNANGTGGIGVKGTGAKYGVFSNGPLGVADGKSLVCTGCIGDDALSNTAGRTRAYAYVNADGTLDTARSRNIAIEKLTTGQYCVKVADVNSQTITSITPVVTVSDSPHFTNTVWTATVSFELAAMSDACTPGQSFLVALFKDVSGSFGPADSDFTIVVP